MTMMCVSGDIEMLQIICLNKVHTSSKQIAIKHKSYCNAFFTS